MKFSYLLVLMGATLAGAAVRADEWDISRLDLSKLPPVADKQGVTYADIKPLLDASCVNCHGENKPKGNLRLDSAEAAVKGGKHSKDVIPGDSKNSLLVAAAAQIDNEIAMPPKRGPGGGRRNGPPGGPGGGGTNAPHMTRTEGMSTNAPAAGGMGGGPGGPGGPGRGGPPAKPLTAEQVGLVRAWIDQGAK